MRLTYIAVKEPIHLFIAHMNVWVKFLSIFYNVRILWVYAKML